MNEPALRMRAFSSWPAPSSPEEQRAAAALAFEDAERRLMADPEELQPHIRFTAWRITREIARVRGLIIANRETLSSLIASTWTSTDEEREKKQPPPADEPIGHTERLAWSLPLAAPADFSQPWVYLAEFVAAYLAVPHRGPQRAALNLLLEEPTKYWPSPPTLADFDEELVQATSRRLLKQSRARVVKGLMKAYGLLQHEAQNICGAAAAQYEYLVQGNKAAQRGLLVARMDDFAHRMREAMHPREEFQALKEIGSLLGLKQPEKEEEEEDMTDVMDRVAGEQDKEAAARLGSPRLDVGPTE